MTTHKAIRDALEAGPQAWNYDSNMRPFYNDLEGHSRGGEFDGTYTLFGAEFEIDGEVYEGPTLSERCKEADAKFIAACNPAAIRALLADLDAKTEALRSVQAAIYMDDAGQLRLTRSFDESVIDTALKGTP